MLTPINPPEASWPGLSQGVLLKGKGFFVTSGQVGTDRDGTIVTSSIEDQVVAMFENIRRVLEQAGLGFEHIARMTSYVRVFDPEIVSAIKAVRARYFNAECPPASVMVQAGLFDPQLHVEAEIIAVVP